MKKTLYDYCVEHRRESLLQQWDLEKNGRLTPTGLSYGSKQTVWWTCDKGHHWAAAVYVRTSGSGCPYCAGKRAWPGENDLASQYPALAAQWHPSLNGTLTPKDVTTGSRRKVWWVCPEGHVWKAVVYSRARKQKTGCPVCAGRGKNVQRVGALASGEKHPSGWKMI